MVPAGSAGQAPVPPPGYYQGAARALHLDALTLVQCLHLLALCRHAQVWDALPGDHRLTAPDPYDGVRPEPRSLAPLSTPPKYSSPPSDAPSPGVPPPTVDRSPSP